MSLIFRLAQSNLQRQLFAAQRCSSFVLHKARSSSCQSSTQNESHDEKNMRLGRPQSPHLTIYAPQMTSLLSISQRISGMTIAGYIVLFSLASLVLPDSLSNYLEDLDCYSIGAGPILFLKAMLAFPMCYHFWNGIRHLIWDTNHFLRLKHVYLTGYVMLLLVFGSTAALIML